MIIVTAPTGAIGHQVLEHVLHGQEPIRVIARDPSRLPPQARDRIDVVQGSHSDAAVVNRAFAGADAVFWLVPPDPRAKTVDAAYVDFTRPACAAFKAHGVKRVVGISALGRGTPAGAQPIVHGQPAPPGRVDQDARDLFIAHYWRSQAAQRLHPRHRGDGRQTAARSVLERGWECPRPRPRRPFV